MRRDAGSPAAGGAPAPRAVLLDARGDAAADVPLHAALSHVHRGRLVVVRGALQALGVFDAMCPVGDAALAPDRRLGAAEGARGASLRPPSGSARGKDRLLTATVVDLSDLAVGEVRGISPTTCVVRTERGVFALARRCPHEGADLAYGIVRDGRLRCPWHNLPIDPETGSQPCASLGTVPACRLEAVDGGRFRMPPELS